MQLARFASGPDATGRPRLGAIDVQAGQIRPLAEEDEAFSLSDLLRSEDVEGAVRERLGRAGGKVLPLSGVHLLAPLDSQEVWGAGVTYLRSKEARQDESEQGGSFYDLVYRADRPELFFKATPSRVVGPGQAIRVRRDTSWCVPEPELALVLSPSPNLRLVGYTVGNDVSARDIEGRNPLYLPQAKVYDACCALGPVITLASAMPPAAEVKIVLKIDRGGSEVFRGETSLGRMARTFDELIHWVGLDNVFPDGLVLLTGTGIIPPDDFSLQAGDVVHITISGIGTLTNPVIQGPTAG